MKCPYCRTELEYKPELYDYTYVCPKCGDTTRSNILVIEMGKEI